MALLCDSLQQWRDQFQRRKCIKQFPQPDVCEGLQAERRILPEREEAQTLSVSSAVNRSTVSPHPVGETSPRNSTCPWTGDPLRGCDVQECAVL